MNARKVTRKVALPYGSGPLYTAFVNAGAVFCDACHAYMLPEHAVCDPNAILRTVAGGQMRSGGTATLVGDLDREEIDAELDNAEGES